MHHCFRIAEILTMIMNYLVDGARGAREVLALMKTCKVLYEPSLDILWRDLDCLAPLVMCLSQDVWKVRNKLLCLTRAPSAKESSRFMFHAKRVRSIGLKHRKIGTLDRFMLRLHRDTADIILPVLSYMCPSLVHLNLYASIDAHTSEMTLSAAVRGFHTLSTLAINTGLSEDAVMHLGQMKNLTTLEACWDHNAPSLTASPYLSLTSLPRRSLFPSLEKLSFSAGDLSICIALVQSIQSQVLESLSLLVVESCFFDVSRFFHLIRSEEHLFPSVRRISIHNLPQMHHSRPVIMSFSNITGVTLKPMFALTNLTFVDLNTLHCTFDLNDEVLLLMATSWPFLQTLYLGHILGWHHTSGVTLDGLVPLVTYCSDLQNLGIVLDATVDPLPHTDGPINDKITHLHLGDSLIEPLYESYPLHIAQFLSGLFPKLTKIYACGRNTMVAEAWCTVEEMVVQLGAFGEITGLEGM